MNRLNPEHRSLTEILDESLNDDPPVEVITTRSADRKLLKKKLRKVNTGSFHRPSTSSGELFGSSSERLDPNGSKIISQRRRKNPKGDDPEEEFAKLDINENTISERSVKDACFDVHTKFDYEIKPCLNYYNFLNVLLDLTNSSFGFLGQCSLEDNQIVFNGVYCRDDYSGSVLENQVTFTIQSRGIIGRVIETKTAQFANNLQDMPEPEVDLPSPLPKQIHNVLCIPFLEGTDKITAISAVFNRSSPFTHQHIRAIEPFQKICGQLIELLDAHILKVQFEESQDRQRSHSVQEPLRSQSFQDSERSSRFSSKRILRSTSLSKLGEMSDKYFGKSFLKKFQNRNNAAEIEQQPSSNRRASSPLRMPSSTNLPVASNSNRTSPQRRALHIRKSWEFNLQKIKFTRSGKSKSQKHPLEFLFQCVYQKDSRSLKKLLKMRKFSGLINEKYNEDKQTLLHVAVRNGDFETVFVLLEAGANLHETDSIGYTPLHIATEYPSTEILLLLLQKSFIDTNAPDNSGNTPFHYFCRSFSSPCSLPEIFDAFVSRGSNINARSLDGETPLHKAVANKSLRQMIVDRLVRLNVDVNVPNKYGNTPLHLAAAIGRMDLVETLVFGNGDTTMKNHKDQTPLEIIREEIERNPSCRDRYRKTEIFLSKTEELTKWMRALGVEKYLSSFIQESLFLDRLSKINDETLKNLGVVTGDRLAIIEASKSLERGETSSPNGSGIYSRESKESNEKPAASPVMSPAKNHATPPGRQRPIRRARVVKVPSVSEDQQQQEEEKKKALDGAIPGKWIKYTDLEFTRQLSQGSSGEVFCGIYKGIEVAIKVLEKQDISDTFEHEFKILSSARGPKVVSFYGACLQPKCLVMEYCRRGSLYDIMKDPQMIFGWKEFLGFAIQMVQGINSLHMFQILHRDVKSMNFLVDENWCIKVCDFGLSRFQSPSYNSTLQKLRGTMIYCAPEVCKGEQYQAKSDIYSIAICLWEMVYRVLKGEYSLPYSEYEQFSSSIQVLLQTPKGVRPTIPSLCPQPIKAIIERCWDTIPDSRPEGQMLLQLLGQCQAHFENNMDEWESTQFQQPSRHLNDSAS